MLSKMIATISADIIRSTSLKTDDLIELRYRLQDLFNIIEKDCPGFWARIVRGDSIECFVPDYRYALRIAILVKIFVKIHVGKFNCSEFLQRYGIRFSIGIGRIKYVNKEDDIIDGPAIYLSGRNLDEISGRDGVRSAFEIEGDLKPLSNILDSYTALLSNLVDSYSTKQSEVIYYKLRGYKEREISERLGIYQSSVNMRASSAQWNLLFTSIRDFEALDFDKICG